MSVSVAHPNSLQLNAADHYLGAHGQVLYRGELLLTESELAAVNGSIRHPGVKVRFEEVRTPPLTPVASSFAGVGIPMVPAAITERPRRAIAVASAVSKPSTPSNAGSPVQPMAKPALQPVVKVSKAQESAIPQRERRPVMPVAHAPVPVVASSAFRSTLMSVLDTLMAEPDLLHCFGKRRVVEGEVGGMDFDTIRGKLRNTPGSDNSKYSNHYEFESDMSHIIIESFKNFPVHSPVYLAAVKLRRMSMQLMVEAVKVIDNKEYFAIPIPDDKDVIRSEMDAELAHVNVSPNSEMDRNDKLKKPKNRTSSSKSQSVSRQQPSSSSSSAGAAHEGNETLKALQKRIAELEKVVKNHKNPAVYSADGGIRPLTADEVSRLERDIGKLPEVELRKLLETKLKDEPALTKDAEGFHELDVSKLDARKQRNLRRYVTMKLNDLAPGLSAARLKKMIGRDELAKPVEAAVEKLMAREKRKREIQDLARQKQQSNSAAPELSAKRSKSASSSGSASDSDGASSSGSGQVRVSVEELQRLRALAERQVDAQKYWDLLQDDGDAGKNLDEDDEEDDE